jgi:hypothetical protein
MTDGGNGKGKPTVALVPMSDGFGHDEFFGGFHSTHRAHSAPLADEHTPEEKEERNEPGGFLGFIEKAAGFIGNVAERFSRIQKRNQMAQALQRELEVNLLQAVSFRVQSQQPADLFDPPRGLIESLPAGMRAEAESCFQGALEMAHSIMRNFHEKKGFELDARFRNMQFHAERMADLSDEHGEMAEQVRKSLATAAPASSRLPINAEELSAQAQALAAVSAAQEETGRANCAAFGRILFAVIFIAADCIGIFNIFESTFGQDQILQLASMTALICLSYYFLAEWMLAESWFFRLTGIVISLAISIGLSLNRLDILGGADNRALTYIFSVLSICFPIVAYGAAKCIHSARRILKDADESARQRLIPEHFERIALPKYTSRARMALDRHNGALQAGMEQNLRQIEIAARRRVGELERVLGALDRRYMSKAAEIERLLDQAEQETLRRVRPVLGSLAARLANAHYFPEGKEN